MKLRYNDEQHAYWLDGVRCKSVTTVAKIPDDTYRLHLWERRQIAIGLAQDKDLLEAVAAHVDDDDLLNKLCEQAKERAGANRSSRRGTAAHRVTELYDASLDFIQTELATSILAGWQEILDTTGLEIVPELMERIVVYPHQRLCGKFDRIAKTTDGRLVIVDLKSGSKAIQYPHAAAVQLALYAHAPFMAGPLNKRGETEHFESMPDVDKDVGIIIHLPEDGPARAVELDLTEAWKKGAKAARACLDWRKTPSQMIVRQLATGTPPPPAWQPPDEGETVTDFELQRLRDDFKRSPAKAQVDVWLKESIDADRSFHPTPPHGVPSARRVAIIRAAITWGEFDLDVVRAGLSLVLGDEVQPTVPIGSVLGSLSIAEAQQFAALESSMSLRFRDDGTPVVVPA